MLYGKNSGWKNTFYQWTELNIYTLFFLHSSWIASEEFTTQNRKRDSYTTIG